jgi:hypothetical protein
MKKGELIFTGPVVCDWVACRCGGRMCVYETAIVHSQPYCQQFENMEPRDYVRWVRIGYQAVIPKQEC